MTRIIPFLVVIFAFLVVLALAGRRWAPVGHEHPPPATVDEHAMIAARLRAVPGAVERRLSGLVDVTLRGGVYVVTPTPSRPVEGAGELLRRVLQELDEADHLAGSGLHGPRVVRVAFTDAHVTVHLGDVHACRAREDLTTPRDRWECVRASLLVAPVRVAAPAAEPEAAGQ